MSEFLATAERLRAVKNAFREFIELWAIDALMQQRNVADRIARDVSRALDAGEIDADQADLGEISENSASHNRSFLHVGRRLDD